MQGGELHQGSYRRHGGGRRCQHVGCLKSARPGGTPYCRSHGGGKRWNKEDCTKAAQGGLMKGEEQAMEFIQRNNDRCRGTYVLITMRLSHSHLRRRSPPSRVGATRSPLAIEDRACHQFTQHSCRPFQPSSTRSSASACSVRARLASPLSQLSARGGGTSSGMTHLIIHVVSRRVCACPPCWRIPHAPAQPPPCELTGLGLGFGWGHAEG